MIETHYAYKLQSSGQVEKINRLLKQNKTKNSHWSPTRIDWLDLLPLLWACCNPYREGFTTYEIMFGRPPPLLPHVRDSCQGPTLMGYSCSRVGACELENLGGKNRATETQNRMERATQ